MPAWHRGCFSSRATCRHQGLAYGNHTPELFPPPAAHTSSSDDVYLKIHLSEPFRSTIKNLTNQGIPAYCLRALLIIIPVWYYHFGEQLNKPLVVATDHIHTDAVLALKSVSEFRIAKPVSSASLLDELAEADVVIVRNPIPAGLFEVATSLKAVIRHGAGLDMIPVEHASKAGVLVANVPQVNANAVAEYVVGQMIAMSRQLPQIEEHFRTSSWEQARTVALKGLEVAQRTVAIVGVGAVGTRVANICTHGFGMSVLGVHPTRLGTHDGLVTYVSLDEALSRADYLVLTCPLNASTEKLICERELRLMKRGSFVINAARGKVIDTDSLCAAVRDKHIAGAALDVFETAPLERSSPLFEIPEIRLTPHIAGISTESMRKMSMGAASQAISVLQGAFPEHWVNRQAREQICARWASIGNFLTLGT